MNLIRESVLALKRWFVDSNWDAIAVVPDPIGSVEQSHIYTYLFSSGLDFRVSVHSVASSLGVTRIHTQASQ